MAPGRSAPRSATRTASSRGNAGIRVYHLLDARIRMGSDRAAEWRCAAAPDAAPVPYPISGMWKPGAALPSSGQRAVTALPRV